MFDISEIIQKIALLAPPVLLAITVHELAHGWVAYKLGDPTAKSEGRLTLNPLSHLDVAGTLVFFITQTIGWAKPVPVNPMYFKRPRKDMIWVALAGPASNIILAVLCALLYRLVLASLGDGTSFTASLMMKMRSIVQPIVIMAMVGVQINLGLAFFNLLPIPPLDGSKILEGIMPISWVYSYRKIERFGFLILLALIFTGATSKLIVPPILFLSRLLIE